MADSTEKINELKSLEGFFENFVLINGSFCSYTQGHQEEAGGKLSQGLKPKVPHSTQCSKVWGPHKLCSTLLIQISFFFSLFWVKFPYQVLKISLRFPSTYICSKSISNSEYSVVNCFHISCSIERRRSNFCYFPFTNTGLPPNQEIQGK